MGQGWLFKGWALGLLLIGVGCARSPIAKTALSGNLPALKSEIVAAQRRGALNDSEVRDIAAAVGERAIQTAATVPEYAQVLTLRPCAAPLASALVERAEGRADAGAATAEMVLLETGLVSPDGLTQKYLRAPLASFRALAARAAVTRDSLALRVQFFRDPEPSVRRAALRAALKVPYAPELDALVEAARRDPVELNRSLATRALGQLGGGRASRVLSDLWAEVGDNGKLAVVDAWSSPATLDAGGAAQLLRVVEQGLSLPGVTAASTLARRGGPESQGIAESFLVAAIRTGAGEVRKSAIRVLPNPEEAVSALRGAAQSKNIPIKLAALGRLVSVPVARDAALKELRQLEGSGDAVGVAARSALARAGDTGILPALEKELGSRSESARVQAALDMIVLGKLVRAAPALADASRGPRLRVACALLGAR